MLEVAVIGVPNPNRLMKCRAYVALRAGNLASRRQQECLMPKLAAKLSSLMSK
jgi:hypothetical protein